VGLAASARSRVDRNAVRSPFPPNPHPIVEVALRPEVLRRNEHAPAGPERPRKRDRPVGRVAAERDVHPAHLPEQRQPRRLPAASAVEPAGAGIPRPDEDG